jgi:Protein of unknown function (DUF2442)
MADHLAPTLTDAQIDAAIAEGSVADLSEPRATKVRYDRRRDSIVVELSNGCSFAFPPRLGQGLENATDDQLAEVTILGAGYGLHWAALDVDLSIQGLLAGIFGTRAHMARLAGRVSTPAKAQAARANGAKGGRPRKLSTA